MLPADKQVPGRNERPEDRSLVSKDFFISYNRADRLWAEWIA